MSIASEGNRMTLRPYHPAYILGYLGLWPNAKMRPAMEYGVERVRTGGPDLEIELVEGYDDICLHCRDLEEDPAGSVWGAGHSCKTSRNPEVVKSVTEENAVILNALGLAFGATLKASALFPLVAEKLPELKNYSQSGTAMIQENYQEGLAYLRERWNE